MAKPFKMKDRKNYYFQVMVDGKRIVESTGETNYNSALKKATERISELRGNANYQEALKRLIDCINTLPVDTRDSVRNDCMQMINEGTIFKLRLETVFDTYKKELSKKRLSQRTQKEYESHWLKFTAWLNENHPEINYLNEISLDVAKDYLSDEWEKGITERTYNERIKKFRAMFSALSKEAGLNKNIWNLIKKLPETTISKKNLTEDQLKKIFEVAEGEMKVLFSIGIYTGLRLGDSATLKWSDVDLEKNIISITPGKTRKHNKKIVIPLHHFLKSIFLYIKNNTPEENETEYILPTVSQKYISAPDTLSKKIQKTFEEVGIKTKVEREGSARKTAVYGFHSFRHSFVSLCANGGIPEHIVMELVGHNSKAVHQVYQHAKIEDKQKAINILPEIGG
jgi:integrase